MLHVTHPTRPDWLERNDWVSWDPLWDGRGFSGADLQHTNYSQLKHTMTNKWEETQMRTFCTTETQESIQQSCDPPWDGRGFSGEILEEKLQNICAQLKHKRTNNRVANGNLNSTDTCIQFFLHFIPVIRKKIK